MRHSYSSKERRMQIDSSVALITGGGRGLGRAFAIALAQHGVKVAVMARTEAEVRATADEIAQSGGCAIALPGDVTDRQAIERTIAITEAELGPIDLLINNAAVFRVGAITAIDVDAWWRDIEINLRGPFLVAQAVLGGMVARRRGRIINVASLGGMHRPPSATSAYAVSKAGLIWLSASIAVEHEASGIVAFAITPGFVRTSMSAYLHDSEEVGRWSPELQAIARQAYAEGSDTPIERSVDFVLQLASGQADALSGCFLSAEEDDLDALVAQADAIQREGRLRLRRSV
jgi:NAD(P)-dependent dehydrogenase (short-subunit alcohol dehydrogenase family)